MNYKKIIIINKYNSVHLKHLADAFIQSDFQKRNKRKNKKKKENKIKIKLHKKIVWFMDLWKYSTFLWFPWVKTADFQSRTSYSSWATVSEMNENTNERLSPGITDVLDVQ